MQAIFLTVKGAVAGVDEVITLLRSKSGRLLKTPVVCWINDFKHLCGQKKAFTKPWPPIEEF